MALEDLPRGARARLAERVDDGQLFSALCAKSTGELVAAIGHETATLFHALAEPGEMPAYLAEAPVHRAEIVLARLIADGVLEVEHTNGEFVHGIAARADLFPSREPAEPSDLIGRLSRSAVEYAARIPPMRASSLARRLYHFNSTPRFCPWTELDAEGALVRWLGLDGATPWSRDASGRYSELGSRKGGTHWLQWTRADLAPDAELRYKIYVSPAITDFPSVFRKVAEVCVALAVPAFKVAGKLAALLRPDRLAVYVEGEEALRSVAAELANELDDVTPHGVPFTTQLDETGVLSAAIDPPERVTVGFRDGVCSWRLLVAERIATSLARSHGLAPYGDRVAFAYDRIRLEGIEPDEWRAVAGWRVT